MFKIRFLLKGLHKTSAYKFLRSVFGSLSWFGKSMIARRFNTIKIKISIQVLKHWSHGLNDTAVTLLKSNCERRYLINATLIFDGNETVEEKM